MRLLLIIGLSLSALAQVSVIPIQPRFELKVEPPGPALLQRYSSGYGLSAGARYGGGIVGHRSLRDDSAHIFLGYDLLIEPQPQPDTFRVTFRELTTNPLNVARGPGGQPFNPAEWKTLPLPVYPAPQVVHPGDTISVDLWVNPDTGQKLVDYISFQQPQSHPTLLIGPGPISRSAPAVPTVSGTARDFSAEDAEMRLVQPRIAMNGTPQDTTPSRGAANAAGTLVWFHLPNHGRYILSLAPRADLGFVKAGEVRGGAITFTLGGDTFTLESNTAITTGYAPYILYVLHDPDWEPTAQAQRGHFQTGSVSPGEIALLRRK
jgi:hypothetical protein